jgi:hypothetical protein
MTVGVEMEKRGWIAASGTFEGSLGWYPEKWNQYQLPNEEQGRSFSLPSFESAVLGLSGHCDEIRGEKVPDWCSFAGVQVSLAVGLIGY